MRHRLTSLTTGLVCILLSVTGAWSQTTDHRPDPAIIRGQVRSNGQPLPRAQLQLSSPILGAPRRLLSDGDGRYAVGELPPGRYTLTAGKRGFVTLSYGQRRPFEKGIQLEVASGQVLDKVDFDLPRSSVIAGRVIDAFGDPVMDAQVVAQRYQYVRGRRQLTTAGPIAKTNDIGEYRVFGLLPGDYYVSARPPIDGSGADAASDDARTLYPGTTRIAEAERVRVGTGETAQLGDLRLMRGRTADVAGVVVGAPSAVLSSTKLAVYLVNDAAATISQLNADGSFVVHKLVPGEYNLIAVYLPIGTSTPLVGHTKVSVDGADVTGVTIALKDPGRARGRITFSSASGKIPPAASIHLRAIPLSLEATFGEGGGVGQAEDDYAFDMRVLEGPAVFRIDPPVPGWKLRSVRSQDNDVTDSGLIFESGATSDGLTIELTDELAELSGTVSDSSNKTLRQYTIIVFPKDRQLWGPLSRFTQTAEPDQNGRFSVTSLLAGDYYVAAVSTFEPGVEFDASFLDRLINRASVVSVGGHTTQTLKLTLIDEP